MSTHHTHDENLALSSILTAVSSATTFWPKFDPSNELFLKHLQCIPDSTGRSSGDRFRTRSPTRVVKMTPMQLWDQGKILKRVVVMHQAPKSTSSFKSETNRFRARSAPGRDRAYVRIRWSEANCISFLGGYVCRLCKYQLFKFIKRATP